MIELEECWNFQLSPSKTIKYYIDDFEEIEMHIKRGRKFIY